jgi:anti-sigma factor RsiW
MNDTTDAAKITPCGGVLNDLKAYIDNELGPARRLSVRAHLSRCAACREEAAALKRISDDFAAAKAAAGEGALSTALRERVLGRMNDVRAQMPLPSDDARPVASAPFWKRRPLATFGWATAALAAWFVAAPLLVPTFSGAARSVAKPPPPRSSSPRRRPQQRRPQQRGPFYRNRKGH